MSKINTMKDCFNAGMTFAEARECEGIPEGSEEHKQTAKAWGEWHDQFTNRKLDPRWSKGR